VVQIEVRLPFQMYRSKLIFFLIKKIRTMFSSS